MFVYLEAKSVKKSASNQHRTHDYNLETKRGQNGDNDALDEEDSDEDED